MLDETAIQRFLLLVHLHNNIPEKYDSVPPAFTEEFKGHLAYFSDALKQDLKVFEIPRSAMSDSKPNRLPGWCDIHIFKSKVGSLIDYVDQRFMPKEEQKKIGFKLS